MDVDWETKGFYVISEILKAANVVPRMSFYLHITNKDRDEIPDEMIVDVVYCEIWRQ